MRAGAAKLWMNERDIDMLRKGMADGDAWAQEYELMWLDEASAWLDYDLISSCEHDAAGKPENYTGGPCFVGFDIAARNDLLVIWVDELVGKPTPPESAEISCMLGRLSARSISAYITAISTGYT